MEKVIVKCEAETAAFAKKFAESLEPGSIVAFKGGLGAGKTTFTRYMCEALDCRDDVSSPTFALVHCYQCDKGKLCQHGKDIGDALNAYVCYRLGEDRCVGSH